MGVDIGGQCPSSGYWLASILDPQYKAKLLELMLPTHKENHMRYFQEALKTNLLKAYLDSQCSHSQQADASGTADQRRRSEGGNLTNVFEKILVLEKQGSSNTHQQCLVQMVEDPLWVRADNNSFPATETRSRLSSSCSASVPVSKLGIYSTYHFMPCLSRYLSSLFLNFQSLMLILLYLEENPRPEGL